MQVDCFLIFIFTSAKEFLITFVETKLKLTNRIYINRILT